MNDGTNEVKKIEAELGALVSRYVEARLRADDEPGTPFVTCWAVSYEYETTQLDTDELVGRGVAVREGQPASASLGLGVMLQRVFEP